MDPAIVGAVGAGGYKTAPDTTHSFPVVKCSCYDKPIGRRGFNKATARNGR